MKIFVLLMCHLAAVLASDSGEVYDGSVGECGGKHQSPINVDTKSLVTEKLPPLVWSNEYYKIPTKMNLVAGHALTGYVEFADNAVPTISGGSLPTTYRLEQFHFHWSQSDSPGGSEHTIDGKRYLTELHAVHVKANLTFEEATQDPEGIVVVGYLYEYGWLPDIGIASLITAFPSLIRDHEEPVSLTFPLPLNNIMPPVANNYISYKGSLTTPPCSESVTWILAPFVNTLSRLQMIALRQFSNSGAIASNNYRTLQPINERTINFVVNNKEKSRTHAKKFKSRGHSQKKKHNERSVGGLLSGLPLVGSPVGGTVSSLGDTVEDVLS